jgi:sodium-independent sulfate anion transporter 11
VITGLVVLLAVQVLTVAFYYIPSAVLSAVVVHAVGDLVTPFGTIQQYWRVSPMEAVIFFVGVAASIIKSIEVGLYASVALSTSALFYRSPAAFMPEVLSATPPTESGTRHGDDSDCSALRKSEEIIALREQARCPGVIKYRLPIDLNYINSGTTMENVLSLVMKLTRNMARGSTSLPYEQERSTRVGGGDSDEEGAILGLPALEAVAFDFTLVRHIDVTAVQKLVDVRKEVDAYAAPSIVEWHMNDVVSSQVQRALLAVGLDPVNHVTASSTSTNRADRIRMADVRRPLLCEALNRGNSGSATHSPISDGAVYGSV